MRPSLMTSQRLSRLLTGCHNPSWAALCLCKHAPLESKVGTMFLKGCKTLFVLARTARVYVAYLLSNFSHAYTSG